MAEDEKPIHFATEVRKRTGVNLDENKIRREALGFEPVPDIEPGHVVVDPNNDRVVKLAMDVLSLVRKHQNKDHNPVLIIAALQVAGGAVGQEYISNYGAPKTQEIILAANRIAQQYKAGFHAEPMDRNQEDHTER